MITLNPLKWIVAAFFAAFVFIPSTAATSTYDDRYEQRLQGLVEHLASTYKVDKDKVEQIMFTAQKYTQGTPFTVLDILSLIAVESSFKANARGPGGAGLMQINPHIHKTKGSWFDPETNIRRGVELLTNYYQDNLQRTLVNYNAGPGGAKKICAKNPRCETRYVQKVVRIKSELVKTLMEQ